MSEQSTEFTQDDMQRAIALSGAAAPVLTRFADIADNFATIVPPSTKAIGQLRAMVRHIIRTFRRYDAERRYAALSPRQRKDALRRRQKGIGAV